MQTRTYGELIDLIQSLIGAGTMLGDEYLKVANFIDRRLAEAYNASPSWARYIVKSEERRVYVLNVSGITGSFNHVDDPYFIYGQDANGFNVYREEDTHNEQGTPSYDIFYYNNSTNKWILAYVAATDLTKDASTGVVTVTNPTTISTGDTLNASSPIDVETWTNEAGVNGTLSIKGESLMTYTQTGKTAVGEFIRIHRKKAFLNDSAIEYDFFLDVEGANILNVVDTNVSSAFATYKSRLDLLLDDLTLSSPVDSTDFVGSAGNAPANRALTVPLEFFYFVAHAAYADFIRLEGKRDEAQVEEAVAQNYLAIELEKIDVRNNNNSINHKFSTYVNRQSR